MKKSLFTIIVGTAILVITPSFAGTSKPSYRMHRPSLSFQSPPFTQCPAIGADSGCGILLIIDENGSLRVSTDGSQGPFDGIEDTLIGVQNNSNKTILSINLSSPRPIFDFDGDGICNLDPHPAGCPFGPTGYEGPGVSFTNINASHTSGVVNFAGGIPPGGHSYFGLEERIETTCPPIAGVPNFKQFSSPWSTDTYGGLPDVDKKGKPNNIQRWGCNMTACANVINYQAQRQGVPFATTPRDLNIWLAGHDGYTADGGVIPSRVVKYAQDNSVQLYFWGYEKRNDFVLDSFLCNGDPVVIGVNKNHHFVTATGQTVINNHDTYSISDPGHNDVAKPQFTSLEGYGFQYSGIRKYSSQARPPNGLYVFAHSPVELLVTDSSGNQTGFDAATGDIISQIPDSSYGIEAIDDDADPSSGESLPEIKIFNTIAPIAGTYNLQVIGTGLGSYTLDVIGFNTNGDQSIFMITGNTSPGLVTTYQIQYSPATGVALPFDVCLQDETNPGNFVLINTTTGDYSFFCNGSPVASGTGTLTTRGGIGSIEQNKGDRRVLIQWDTTAQGGKGAGTATLMKVGGKITCQITDRDMSNNTCTAPQTSAPERKPGKGQKPN